MQSVAVPSTRQPPGAAPPQTNLDDSRNLIRQDEQIIKGAVKSPTKIIDQYEQSDLYKTLEEKQMERCPNCDRTFLMGRLTLHLRNCTKKHPMKKLNTRNMQRYQESCAATATSAPKLSVESGREDRRAPARVKERPCKEEAQDVQTFNHSNGR